MLKSDGKRDVVFLLDVDNTLLDNDRFKADLDERLLRDFGADGRDRYWAAYESERARLGYADYLAALQAFREGLDDDRGADARGRFPHGQSGCEGEARRIRVVHLQPLPRFPQGSAGKAAYPNC